MRLQAGKLEGTVCWKLSRLQFSNQRKTEKGENTTFFLIFEKRSLFHCQLLLQVGCALQAKSLQSCMILCDPMDCSLPGSSVHGILQARYWSGLPCSSPEDLPNPGIKPATPPSPALAGGFFTTSTILEALRVRQGSLFFCSYMIKPELSRHYGKIISGFSTMKVFHFEISTFNKLLFFKFAESMS